MATNKQNDIDEIIHQRTRLSIMASLAGVDSLDFNELKADLQLTDGNLSTHLSQLDKAGYINITKKFKAKKPKTIVTISAQGRIALKNYINMLQSLLDKAK